MLNFISVPTDFTTNVGTQASDIISDLTPVATLIIGIFLGLFLLSWAIDKFRDKND